MPPFGGTFNPLKTHSKRFITRGIEIIWWNAMGFDGFWAKRWWKNNEKISPEKKMARVPP